MATYAVEVKKAVKEFKETKALDDVTLSFESGKIHGIVGRNGSGKTVLLKCICGFMELTSGQILVQGQKVVPAKPQNIGIIIESPGFIGSQSGFKNLYHLASLNGKLTRQEVEGVIKLVGLDPQNKKPVRKYSLGMRQRLGIAQAIMEDSATAAFGRAHERPGQSGGGGRAGDSGQTAGRGENHHSGQP